MAEHIRQHAGVKCDVDIPEMPELSELGRVDDYYASIEWSSGGMVHAHIAFWMVGSPRIDRVTTVGDDECGTEKPIRVDDPMEDDIVMVDAQAAALLGQFWERVYTECNIMKGSVNGVQMDLGASLPRTDAEADGADGRVVGDVGPRAKMGKKMEREKPSPESISTKTLLHCLLGRQPRATPTESSGTPSRSEDAHRCWRELDDILVSCSRLTSDIHEATSDDTKRARARRIFVGALAEWVNMHDWHKPFAQGPPARGQACCSVENENSKQERYTCNKL